MVITIVRSSGVVTGSFGFGGCGISASKPFGGRGVITIKMMISTSSTSIIGVILISDLGPPPPPIDIAIRLLLLRNLFLVPRRERQLSPPMGTFSDRPDGAYPAFAQSRGLTGPRQPIAGFVLRPAPLD